MKNTTISVVIPVYNEEKAIIRCLESLGMQTVRSKEIIVVDDGSTDKTLKEISKLQVTGYRLQVLKQHHKGAGAARNFGASKSTGDILVFVDADMRFHPQFLEELTSPIRKRASKGTFSKQEFISNWGNVCARFWNYWRGLYEPIAVPRNFPDHSPVFRSVLREEFVKVHGFDETRGYNDDWSLSERLGYQATETKAVFYHANPSSMKEVFLQARWTAKRSYRHGIMGVFGALVRAIPVWSVPLAWNSVRKRRDMLTESFFSMTLFSFLFFFVAQSGVTIGIIEFLMFKTPQK